MYLDERLREQGKIAVDATDDGRSALHPTPSLADVPAASGGGEVEAREDDDRDVADSAIAVVAPLAAQRRHHLPQQPRAAIGAAADHDAIGAALL